MKALRIVMMIFLSSIIWGLLTGCSANGSGANPIDIASNENGALVAMVPRPTAPAAEDNDFREDSYTQVAATGKPQLLEVFEYS
jgi:hypothetical protein